MVFLIVLLTKSLYCSLTKPQSFADCVGDELPVGWEQVLDLNRGVYYVNHAEARVQAEDPRLEWRALQEDMLRHYLVTAQEDLQVCSLNCTGETINQEAERAKCLAPLQPAEFELL